MKKYYVKFAVFVFLISSVLCLCMSSVYCKSGLEWGDDGDFYYSEGKYEKAIECYKEALKEYPDSDKLYFKIGNCYLKLTDYDKAIEYYETCLDKNSSHELASEKIKEAEKLKEGASPDIQPTANPSGLRPPAGNFEIKDFTYLDGPNGNPVSKSSFKVGTTFYFQFKVYGFEMDKDNFACVVEDLILESTEGEVLQIFDNLFEFNEKALVDREPADFIFFTNQLSFPEDTPPGNYVAHIVVTDKFSGKTAESKHNFTLTK